MSNSSLMSGYSRSNGRELRQQHGVQHMIAAGDAHGAGRLVAQFRQRLELGLDLVEAVADGLHQPLAGRGRRDAARGARQQPDLQPLLQPADGLAERRLRDAQRARRPG